MKNQESKETNNQQEQIGISDRTQNIFNTKDENQKLKELQNQIEQLALNSKDEHDSPRKLSKKEENQRKNFSQKETPIVYNITEEEGLKEMNKINLPIQPTRDRGRAKTNFPQKEMKHTPSYNYQKSSGSNLSPLYSYYDESSKYLSKNIHLEEENNKSNFQFSSSKNVNPNRNKIINTINSITSPKGDSTNETPNYNDFNFFSNNNNNNNNKSPEINNNLNNNFNGNFINGYNDINVINNNQFKNENNNLNINYDNNNNNYLFNFQKLNYGLEQGENQLNQFPNFTQMTLNSFPTNYQNQLYFQNNIMLNNDNSNNVIQQNQISKLNPEDYIFEKFGKRGWQCEKCNNFNFESKIIFYIIM